MDLIQKTTAQLIASINPSTTVPAPDPAVFVVNQDNSVTYTPPAIETPVEPRTE